MTHNPLLDVPEIARAVGVLHAIANDPRERELYEDRVEQIRLEKARMSYARDKGLQEGAIQFARETLLRLGLLRFGAAPPEAAELVNAIDDRERLSALIDQTITATDWEQVVHSMRSTVRSS